MQPFSPAGNMQANFYGVIFFGEQTLPTVKKRIFDDWFISGLSYIMYIGKGIQYSFLFNFRIIMNSTTYLKPVINLSLNCKFNSG